MRLLGFITLTLLVLSSAPLFAEEDINDVVKELKEEVKALRSRVKELESKEKQAGGPVIEEGTIGEAIDKVVTGGVSASKSERLVIGGQIRVRPEVHWNNDFDDDGHDTLEFVVLRTRLFFDFDVAESLRAYVKLQDSRLFGEEGGTLGDLEGLDLLEGFVDFERILGEGTNLRAGRHQMNYGAQRMISTLDWHPVGRSWDGAWLTYDEPGVSVDLFATILDENLLKTGESENEDFYGLYTTFAVGDDAEASGFVLYRTNLDSDDITGEDGKGGHEKLWTIGGRFNGESEGFKYDVIGVYQFGDHANDDVSAWMFEALAGYTFSDVDWKPYVGASFIYASGDDDPTDGDRDTYDQLYTFGHYYLGYMDFVGRQNILSPMLRLSAKPAPEWSVFLDTHFFWLDQVEDGLYGATGKSKRGGDPSGDADSFVGWEIDLSAKVKVSKNVMLWFGYSHFFTGDFLDDTGTDDDADFLFCQVTVNF